MGNLFEDNSLFTPSIEKQGKSSANLSDIKNNVSDSKKKFENQEQSFGHLSDTTNVTDLKSDSKDQEKSSSQISDTNDLFVNDVSDSKKKSEDQEQSNEPSSDTNDVSDSKKDFEEENLPDPLDPDGFSDPEKKCYSITEISNILLKTMKNIGNIWLEGEITECVNSKGSIYLTLKDPNNPETKTNQIRATLWSYIIRRLDVFPKVGDKVQIYGDISLYASQYSINIRLIEYFGEGRLLQRYMRLKRQLGESGYFDMYHKKRLPFLPKTIGIITSKDGAAIHDMLNSILSRFENVHIYVCDTKVQGQGAAEDIANAIQCMNEANLGIEVLIIGRGGGSMEDLWAFNEKVVADAIYNSQIPIISAVGHERDHPLSDFVSDAFAITPTQAGEKVIPKMQDLIQKLEDSRRKLKYCINYQYQNRVDLILYLSSHRAFQNTKNKVILHQQSLQENQNKLQYLKQDIIQRRQNILHEQEIQLQKFQPLTKINTLKEQLNLLEHKLIQCIQNKQKDLSNQLHGFEYKLDALNPLSVLQRGYSIAYSKNGEQILSHKSQVQVGDIIWTRMEKTWICSQVINTGDLDKKKWYIQE